MQHLYQHQTLGDLMAGLFDGTLTIDELKKRGDLGIGTFDAFDGEMVLLDGVVYQIRDDGQVYEVDDQETTPYAAVSKFQPDTFNQIKQPMTLKKLRATIQEMVRSKNVFSVIRIDGHFPFVQARAVSRQTKPYPRLVNATTNQVEFERLDVKGTAIGILTPELFDGVSKGGFHCHFISENRDFGGHILDYIVDDAKVEIQTIDALVQTFATDYDDFMHNEIDYENLAEEMEIAEG